MASHGSTPQTPVRGEKGRLEQALQGAAVRPGEVKVLFSDEASFYRQPTQAWDYPRITARRLQECWLRAARRYPEAKTVYLVLDNWPVHLHPTALAACQKDRWLVLIWLPIYAPWLNAIEKLWCWVKQLVTQLTRSRTTSSSFGRMS